MNIRIHALSILMLAGCAASPLPIQSAWYLQYRNGEASSSSSDATSIVYITLLNRSDKTIYISDVIVNDTSAKYQKTWHLVLPVEDASKRERSLPMKLEPGHLYVLSAAELQWQRVGENDPEKFDQSCLLPISVDVVVIAPDRNWFGDLFDRMKGDIPGSIHAELVGRMPSALPDRWEQSCKL